MTCWDVTVPLRCALLYILSQRTYSFWLVVELNCRQEKCKESDRSFTRYPGQEVASFEWTDSRYRADAARALGKFRRVSARRLAI